MLKLYSSDNSVCTQKVLMTLNEKALSFEIKKINLFNNFVSTNVIQVIIHHLNKLSPNSIDKIRTKN